jgi:hypothetical protein
MTAFDVIDYAWFEDVAKVAMQYYQGVTLNPIVYNALRAMDLDNQQRESKGKGLREIYCVDG